MSRTRALASRALASRSLEELEKIYNAVTRSLRKTGYHIAWRRLFRNKGKATIVFYDENGKKYILDLVSSRDGVVASVYRSRRSDSTLIIKKTVSEHEINQLLAEEEERSRSKARRISVKRKKILDEFTTVVKKFLDDVYKGVNNKDFVVAIAEGLEKVVNDSDLVRMFVYGVYAEQTDLRPGEKLFEEIVNEAVERLDKKKSNLLEFLMEFADIAEDPMVAVSYLYILGKEGDINKRKIRNRIRRFLNKIDGVEYAENVAKVGRSNKYFYTKQLPLYANILLLEDTLGKYINILPRSLSRALLQKIVPKMVERESRRIRRLFRRERTDVVYKPVSPALFLSKLKDIVNRAEILVGMFSKYSPEEVRRKLLLMIGVSPEKANRETFDITVSRRDKRIVIRGFVDGKKFFEKDYTAIEEDVVDIILHDIYTALSNKGYMIDYTHTSDEAKKAIIYRVLDNGFYVVYPEKRLYKYSDPSFIKRYWMYQIAEMHFKRMAKEKGYEYPDIAGGYKFIYKLRRPKLAVVEAVDGYYFMIGDEVIAKEDSLEKLLRHIEEEMARMLGILPGDTSKLSYRYLQTVIKVLKELGYTPKLILNNTSPSLLEFISKTDIPLSKVRLGGVDGWIDPRHVIFISAEANVKLPFEDRERYVTASPNDIQVVDMTGARKSLEQTRLSELKKGRYYIVINTNKGEFAYPAELGLAVKVFGKPKEVRAYLGDHGLPGVALLIYDDRKVVVTSRAS